MDDIKQITLRIDMNLYDEVKGIADAECRTVSQQIEYMIRKFLEIKR